MILTLIEYENGALNKNSLETVMLARSLANQLNTSMEAVLFGEEGRPLADDLAAHGVSKVILVNHDRLTEYAPEAWAQSIIHLVEAVTPQAILAAGTDRGNEVMSFIGARLGMAMAANCIEVTPGDDYQVTRTRWGGSLLEEAWLRGKIKLMTVAPHMIQVEEAPSERNLIIQDVTPDLDDKDFRVQVKDHIVTAGDKVSLGEARVVIGGGRGVGSSEGFAALDELAGLLDGAVGGSRVVTNLGWRPHADQIGQTGTRIAPDLYIACGISGAIQHMVGCKGSKRILAINNDPEAPIIAKSDYAVIGDLKEVLPALTDAIRKIKST